MTLLCGDSSASLYTLPLGRERRVQIMWPRTSGVYIGWRNSDFKAFGVGDTVNWRIPFGFEEMISTNYEHSVTTRNSGIKNSLFCKKGINLVFCLPIQSLFDSRPKHQLFACTPKSLNRKTKPLQLLFLLVGLLPSASLLYFPIVKNNLSPTSPKPGMIIPFPSNSSSKPANQISVPSGHSWLAFSTPGMAPRMAMTITRLTPHSLRVSMAATQVPPVAMTGSRRKATSDAEVLWEVADKGAEGM